MHTHPDLHHLWMFSLSTTPFLAFHVEGMAFLAVKNLIQNWALKEKDNFPLSVEVEAHIHSLLFLRLGLWTCGAGFQCGQQVAPAWPQMNGQCSGCAWYQTHIEDFQSPFPRYDESTLFLLVRNKIRSHCIFICLWNRMGFLEGNLEGACAVRGGQRMPGTLRLSADI